MGCLLWLFTALLALLLVVQIPFVLLFALDREVDVPTGIVRRLGVELSSDEYRITFSSATLDKYGIVRFSDPQVRGSNGRRLLTADRISVDLFLPSTLLGFPRIDRIEAINVGLWNPTGPLGAAEPFATALSVAVQKKGADWEIDDFRASLDNLDVAAAGKISEADLAILFGGDVDAAAVHAKDFDLEEWIEMLVAYRSQLSRVRHPFLRADLTGGGDGAASLRLIGTASRVEFPGGFSLVEDCLLQGTLRLDQNPLSSAPLVFSGESLMGTGGVAVEKPLLGIRFPAHIADHWRYDGTVVSIEAGTTSFDGGILEYPTLDLRVNADLSIALLGQASLFDNAFDVEGTIARTFRSASLRIGGVLVVDEVLSHPAAPSEVSEADLDFGEGLFVMASTELNLGEGLPRQISYRVQTLSPINLAGFEAVYADASGTFLPGEKTLDVERLSVETPTFHLNGKYSHHFPTNEFRFLVDGTFHPSAIDGWMRPWWQELWGDFQIPEPAGIDLALEGDWDYRDDRRLFGAISFRNITMQGTPVSRGHARMWSRPYFFELFDLEAYRPEGRAIGSFGNVMNWETRETFAFLYDLQSTFSLDAVSPLLGDRVKEIVDLFQTDVPPELKFSGVILPEESTVGDPREQLIVEARTDAPLSFKGIFLDSLSLSAVYADELTVISPLRFGLGGGIGEATVRWNAAAGDDCSIQLDFSGGCPAEVVRAIPLLAEQTAGRFTDSRTDKNDRSRNLDFAIECSGDPSDPESLFGEGTLDLRTPNLANVRLLGILSRISEELPLPVTIGSFAFNRAEAKFLLNRGLVEFNRFNLHSPSSMVVASGSYDMAEAEVDFDARMELLGGVKIPILAQIGYLLSPVGKVFEFRVFGPVDDMKWRLFLDPRSW